LRRASLSDTLVRAHQDMAQPRLLHGASGRRRAVDELAGYGAGGAAQRIATCAACILDSATENSSGNRRVAPADRAALQRVGGIE